MSGQGPVDGTADAAVERSRPAGDAARWMPARWAAPWIGAVALAAAGRILWMIDRHAVNLLYWDQFTLYRAFTGDAGAWELFRWQHGPHRQGVAFWLTAWIADATRWNTRCEAFAVGAAICAAAALALWLRRRLYGPFHAADAAIPLLILTPAQYGIFAHTPNLSHSAAPLALLLAFCLAFTLRRRALRYGALVALDFALIHTGFGLFAGALAPVGLGLCALRDRRALGARGVRLPAAAAALSLACVGAFAVDYATAELDPATATRAPLVAHAAYAALMFANVLGVKGTGAVPLAVGAIAAIAALGVAVEQLVRLARRPDAGPRELAILTLCAFTLLFAAGAAAGRIALGIHTAQATRYVPLVVPAFLGLYLRLQPVARPRLRAGLLASALVMIALATIPMRTREARFLHQLSRGKRIWVEAYLETGDLEIADARAGLRIFPFASPEVPRMLDYMRERRLNLFTER